MTESTEWIGRHRTAAVAGAVAAVLLVTFAGIYTVTRAQSVVSVAVLPFDHFVFVVMENHAYDNYFGTYCTVTGPYCPNAADGLPAGTCVPVDPVLAPRPCVGAFAYNRSAINGTPDLSHTWRASHIAYDSGSMDGFLLAEGENPATMGHYDGSTIPVYWDMAQHFALGDGFYSSMLSFSLPNHWRLVSGTAPEILDSNTNIAASFGVAHTYLNEANATPTIADTLVHTNVSWKYYEYPLNASYPQAIGSLTKSNYSAYRYWNPFAAKGESYSAPFLDHFVPTTSYFGDLANRTLPAVSWVIPPALQSDHPPDNITEGEQFVASVVDATENSAYWNRTAIFLFWDDYGGFYDHVSPPSYSTASLGFRVPLVVISPYTPAGLVVHDLGYFDSFLHLIEWKYHLDCLGNADCGAPLPFGYFNFSGAPRAPVYFPISAANATYPMGAPLARFPGIAISVFATPSSSNDSLAD